MKVFLPMKNGFIKTYHNYSLSVLRNIILPIHYKIMESIIQFFKSTFDNRKGITLVMRHQILHIFKKKAFGL